MKMRPLQLCRWCAFFVRWRWLTLAAAALISLLLPGYGRTVAVTLVIGAGAVLLLHLLLRRAACLPGGQRTAHPRDALAETVLVDTALIGQGTMLRAAAQPVDVADGLSLRLGSGALLLGTAMAITADGLPQTDLLAIHRAVQQLNIVPERLRSHQPTLARTMEGDVHCIRVRDGLNERCYYRGEAEDVLALCPRIWEGAERGMTDHDQLRIRDTARYIAQGKCRVLAYATCKAGEEPIFLGLAGIGEEIDVRATKDIAALRDMGLTVMLRAPEGDETDLDALHALLDLPRVHARPDIHLCAGSAPMGDALCLLLRRGSDLVAPLRHLREGYMGIECALRRFTLMLALALLPCLPTGWAALPACGILLCAVYFLGDRGQRAMPGWITFLLAGVTLALSWLLLSAVEGTALAHGIIALLGALGAAMRLCGVTGPKDLHGRMRGLWYVLGASGAGLAMALVIGLVTGTALISVLFGLIVGLLIAVLAMYGK